MLYAVGGVAGNVALGTVEAYTAGTNRWTAKAMLPQALVSSNGAGVIKGVLYVTGSYAAGPQNTLYAYNPSTNAWTVKAPMPTPGGCGATGVIAGQLYVYSNCSGTNAFQRYDPFTNGWLPRAIPNIVHSFPAAGVINGKFYLAGGETSNGGLTPALEVYDPGSNTWTSKTSMPSQRFGPAVR